MGKVGPQSKIIRKRVWTIGLVMILLSTILLVITFRYPDSFLGQVELKTVDWRFRMRGPAEPDPQITICAIDQKALDILGRWPWPRNVTSELITKLSEAGAKVTVMDISFSHAKLNVVAFAISSMNFLEPEVLDTKEYQDFIALFEEDKQLADAIRKSNNVVLGYFFLMNTQEAAYIGADMTGEFSDLLSPFSIAIIRQLSDVEAKTVHTAHGAEPNIKIFADSTAGAGFFNVIADADGTQRHKSMLIKYNGLYYPALELEALRLFYNQKREGIQLELSEFGVSQLKVGNNRIPVDESGRILINYRGPAHTYTTISAADVYMENAPKDAFKDKVVFIGTSAPGIFDETTTPFTRQGYSGVEMHATAFDNMLNEDCLIMPAALRLVDLLVIILLPFLLTLVLSLFKPNWGALFYIAAMLLFLVGIQVVFTRFRLVLAMLPPMLAMTSTFIGALVVHLQHEIRVKNKVHKAFKHYLPMQIVDQISEYPAQASLGGIEIDGTVLFCDLVGFTQIASKLTAAETVLLLNKFHNAMTDMVFESIGTLDKFIGDAMMAFWGAPVQDLHHAAHACQCALRMMETLEELNKFFAVRELPILQMRIGINSGLMISGNIGGMKRFDYTVIGDTVNRGQRLESLCREIKVPVLVGERCYELAKDKFNFEYAGEHVLIVGTEKVPVYTFDKKITE